MFVELIYTLNTLLASLPLLQMIVPILADVFVFVYPVYLLWLYFVSSSIQHKIAAASIVTSAILGVAVNYTLKFWLPSPRPFTVLDLEVNPHDALVLRDLPEMTFPSDHAMMGAVIATSILIRAYRTQDTKSIYI
jgi:membrane-associated phospholipid phosphatase